MHPFQSQPEVTGDVPESIFVIHPWAVEWMGRNDRTHPLLNDDPSIDPTNRHEEGREILGWDRDVSGHVGCLEIFPVMQAHNNSK